MSPFTVRYAGSSLNRKHYEKNNKHCLPVPAYFVTPDGKLSAQFVDAEQPQNESIQALQSEQSEKPLRSISQRSKAKITAKLQSWFLACKYLERTRQRKPAKFAFVTLTFINNVEDKHAVEMLNKFFNLVRRKRPNFEYLWTAERQTNNVDFPSNIHFHIFTNTYLDVKVFNRLWLTVQVNSGILSPAYKSEYGDRLKWHTRKELKFSKKYHEMRMAYAYNPFDVKYIKQYKSLIPYLVKYVIKQDSSFNSAAWNCSKLLSHLCTGLRSGDYPLFDPNGRAMSYTDYALQHPKNNYVDKETGEQIQAVLSDVFLPQIENSAPRLLFSRVPIYEYEVVEPLLNGLHAFNAIIMTTKLEDRYLLHYPLA